MIKRILPLLNKLIPTHLRTKGLSKIDSRLGKFIALATGAGYSADSAFDYLQDQFEPVEGKGKRPDELASEKRIEQSNALPNALGTAGKAAIGAGAIGAVPAVIGSLFNKGNDEEEEEENLSPKDRAMREAVKKARTRKESPESPLGAASLGKQFEQGYGQNRGSNKQDQVSQALNQLTEFLKKAKGGG